MAKRPRPTPCERRHADHNATTLPVTHTLDASRGHTYGRDHPSEARMTRRTHHATRTLLVPLLALILLAIPATVFAQSIVTERTGTGIQTTRPFTVDGPWELQWDARGDIFQVFLYDENGSMVDLPANQTGAGSGSSYQANGGRYYLEVNAIGSWTVRVVTVNDVPSGNASATGQPVEFQGTGGRNTRPFTMNGPWELQWDARGDIFQVYLYDENGSMVDVAANQTGAGSGQSYQASPGTYYLQVNAIGAWTITVQPAGDATGGANAATLPVTIEGTGGRNTRPFTARGAWELQWDARGDIFQVYLYDENGGLITVAANQMGGGRGRSYQPRSGTYYLQVNAIGAWAINIVPVD